MLLGSIVYPIGFLIIAVIDDLIFKKFHNFLFIALSLIGFSIVALSGIENLIPALFGFLVGGLIMLPLVLFGALGAGDLKFMMCLGILMGVVEIIEIFVFSLFWGALLGCLSLLFAQKFKAFKNNLKEMLYFLKPVHTHKIPYTVAIALGWLTSHFWGGLL